jgi:uncharacterized membrane protein
MASITYETMTCLARILHIGSAIALAGGGFLWTIVVSPALTTRVPGPTLGALMATLGPRLGRYFSSLSYVVLASGLSLLALIWGWRQLLDVLFGGSLYGSILLVGILAFLVGLVLAETILMPTGRKLTSLPPGTPPGEIARLQRRSARTFVAIAFLDLAALSMMALAVNARA